MDVGNKYGKMAVNMKVTSIKIKSMDMVYLLVRKAIDISENGMMVCNMG